MGKYPQSVHDDAAIALYCKDARLAATVNMLAAGLIQELFTVQDILAALPLAFEKAQNHQLREAMMKPTTLRVG